MYLSTRHHCPSVCLSVCLCVCLSVCLSASIGLSVGSLDRSARNFVRRLPVAVARSCSGGVALCYVGLLPSVLWMTSRLAVTGASPERVGSMDVCFVASCHSTTNVTSSIQPEVHNVSQRRQRRTEPRRQGICAQNFVPIGPAVQKTCSRTDRQTDRQTDKTDRNSPLCYRDGVISPLFFVGSRRQHRPTLPLICFHCNSVCCCIAYKMQ